jgi:predicted regulator of Ras-like GTPase activity (Roadblock/LC7/MglB family)
MPYQRLINELTRGMEGVQGALLLDSEGEVAVEAGARDVRHRLIGAYQGIALAVAKRTMRQYDIGSIRHIVCRYDGGQLILRPLKDGYFLIVSFAPGANLPRGLYRSEAIQEQLNAAL